MRKRLAFSAVMLLAFSTAVFGQSFVVNYLDGTVELKSASGWTEISIGKQLAIESTIRISDSGSVELQRGKSRITILKDGTYALKDLASASDKAGAAGFGSNIAQKLQTLASGKQAGTTVGGVRAAEQGSGGSVMWVEESEETRGKVADLLSGKNYEEAAKVLTQAIAESSSPADNLEYTYLLASAYYGNGQAVKAYRALASISPNQEVGWYPRYLVLKAQVLLDSLAYDDALKLLAPYIKDHPEGEATQVAYLLSYYCKKGLGDGTAKTDLQNGLKIDPNSETGAQIQQVLNAP